MSFVPRLTTALVLITILAGTTNVPVAFMQNRNTGQPSDYQNELGGAPKAKGNIKLIEPLTGQPQEIEANGNALFRYIETGLGYFQEIAVGITILWLLVGGMMIMVSGNNNSLREQGKQHATWAIGGLLMLFLLGFILELLNSSFFHQ